IPGSTCISPRPTPPGSTRSNGSSASSPPTCSNEATTAAFKPWKPISAPGSKPGTRIPHHSCGPSPPNRSSPHSDDFYSELPAQDTRSARLNLLYWWRGGESRRLSWPGERVASIVPAHDEGANGGDELFDAVEGSAADGLAGDAEEPLDQVQPGAAGGCEVPG